MMGHKPAWITMALPLLLATAIMGVALAARWHGLGAQDLSCDEVSALVDASGRARELQAVPLGTLLEQPPPVLRAAPAPWWVIWTQMQAEAHVPLYFVVLRAFTSAFGTGEIAVRLPSVLPSVVAVGLVFALGRTLFGLRAACWAALLMALSPTQVDLAQHERMYPLLVAETTGAALALARLWARGPGGLWAATLGACALAMMLTHYFGLGPCVAIVLLVLFVLRGAARRQAVMALVAATAVYLVAWGPFAWSQHRAVRDGFDWTVFPEILPYTTVVHRVLREPIAQLFEPLPNMVALSMFGGILYVLPLLLGRHRPALRACGLWLACAVALVAVPDALRGAHQLRYPRYTATAAPAICLIVAALPWPARWRGALSHLVPLVLCVGCAAALPDAYAPRNPIFRTLVSNWCAATDGGADPALIAGVGMRPDTLRHAYAALEHYGPAPLPAPLLITQRPPDDQAAQRLLSGRRLWVWCCGQSLDPPDALGRELPPGWTVGPHRRLHWMTGCWYDLIRQPDQDGQAVRGAVPKAIEAAR